MVKWKKAGNVQRKKERKKERKKNNKKRDIMWGRGKKLKQAAGKSLQGLGK